MPKYAVTVERRVRATMEFEIEAPDQGAACALALVRGEEQIPGAGPPGGEAVAVTGIRFLPEATEHLIRASYTDADDGVHLVCSCGAWDHVMGFEPTVVELALAAREHQSAVRT